MQQVKIRWYGPFNIDDIYELDFEILDYLGIYMFLYRNKIVYIGQAYYQSMRNRIKQHLSGDSTWEWVLDNYNPRYIRFKLGDIEYLGQQKITKQLVDDIESLLIATQQPSGNIQSTRAYWGRNLKITNLGERKPLPRTLSTNIL
jgi:hypothetical protein